MQWEIIVVLLVQVVFVACIGVIFTELRQEMAVQSMLLRKIVDILVRWETRQVVVETQAQARLLEVGQREPQRPEGL